MSRLAKEPDVATDVCGGVFKIKLLGVLVNEANVVPLILVFALLLGEKLVIGSIFGRFCACNKFVFA